MKLLFISIGARVIYDDKNNQYLNAHMNRDTIKRYFDISTELRIILRDSEIRCSKEEAEEKYNPFPHDLASLIVCYNPYSPKSNVLNIRERRTLNETIKKSVDWADRVIIASGNGPYSNAAVRACKDTHTPYMIMVGGFAFESDWYHGITGKFSALFREKDTKRNLKDAPYALYVTQKALQIRYPCSGRTIGCSDVQIREMEKNVLDKRICKINSKNKEEPFFIGTAAAVDIKWKGHRYVIEALSLLKKRGYTEYKYQLIGSGDSTELKKLAEKRDVSDQVYFLGSKPHDDVESWMDSIDIYIQPSFTEGLCRSIVEAMSRACPVLASRAGGNTELCSGEFMFTPGRADEIADCILKISSHGILQNEAVRSYKKAYEFSNNVLEQKRKKFMLEFMA